MYVKTDEREALMPSQAAHVDIPMQKLITALLRQCQAGHTAYGCRTRLIVFTCLQIPTMACRGRSASDEQHRPSNAFFYMAVGLPMLGARQTYPRCMLHISKLYEL